MRVTGNARITYVWVALSAITIVSWGLATAREGTDLVSNVPITIGVLALALVKVRFILQDFMEVRTAPQWLRRFTDIWLVTFWTAILAIYLY
jgi:hypothetical protein